MDEYSIESSYMELTVSKEEIEASCGSIYFNENRGNEYDEY